MTQTPDMATARFERGALALAEIDGHGGQAVVDALGTIAPDFARYLIEFPFGDIYSRPGLDLRAREVATIAALTAMGNATSQLKVHIRAGLNVGLSRDEIVEILMQMAVHADGRLCRLPGCHQRPVRREGRLRRGLTPTRLNPSPA